MGLTAKRVRDAKPSGKTRIEWDDDVKGLGLRITPGGAKAFVFNYRMDNVSRRMTLGRTSELSLADARSRAMAAKQAVRVGQDPLEMLRIRKSLPTVSEALDRFQSDYMVKRAALGRLSDKTSREYNRQIERNLRPALGRKRVQEVTQKDVERMLAPLAPIIANRVLALASKFFRCCEDWELRPQNSNPARGIEKAVEEPRDRTLSADELGALGRALSELDENEAAILAIRLAALTGLRIGEVRSMRWEDINLQSGQVVLPKTKTGRRVHTLPAAAVNLLADTKQLSAWVIPGRDIDKPLDLRWIRRVFERTCRAAGIEGARLHDLRRTVMTQAASMGVGAHLLRDMLGHKTTAMADRYIRNAGQPLTELRERVGAGMAAILSNGELQTNGGDSQHDISKERRRSVGRTTKSRGAGIPNRSKD